jgi:hypothetical protein
VGVVPPSVAPVGAPNKEERFGASVDWPEDWLAAAGVVFDGGAAAVDGTPGAGKLGVPPRPPNPAPPGSRNMEAICNIVLSDSGLDLKK